ncbi:MAG: tetratricopeptide repeat protein [Victivallaceae bacterium]|nr:tetratricopeptide repeat protein [Victivallaceae bacterium]
MEKSLVPLIVSLSLIVLLTAVIINTTPEMRHPAAATDAGTKKPGAIHLSNIHPPADPGPKPRNYLMDKKALLNMLLQACSELDNGKIDEAEDKVQTVLVFQPENSEALSLLGKIYYLQHKYKKAEMIFRKQVKLNKKSASAYNNLGQVLLKQEKCSQAAVQFRLAQELDPESGLIALNLSGAYSRQGKKRESLVSFKRAFELLGTRIITVANHADLDHIRHEKEFREILAKAYQELSATPKKDVQPQTSPKQP